ncbi:HlyD family secretion protein [Alcanivorax sp. DP30]|uniref:HlyD family efflux transporter periplasmic adaptor subunit n=1 Tax=Alcanivorax sp. DP30 TaxID=2606217 RepID=UPI0013680ECD|nr:HlyD family secretion protein [Alcanivorax sp. DP30]MZR61955.1 HlyD family efflux transporter periplasmic adaptor subunit [Alcanivorax sp. DP30]
MSQPLRILLTVAVVVLAIIAGNWIWNYYLYAPWTRDGKVRAQIITLSPDVSGWISELPVHDNQAVSSDSLLLRIDPQRYQAAASQARARLEVAQTRLAMAELQREKASGETRQQASLEVKLASADLDMARAELTTAELDLQRTEVRAPADGTVVNLTLQKGNFAERGIPVLSMVKAGSFYVTGYFEETKLPLVHIGQRATVVLMNGAHSLQGKVTSVGQAIANANTRTDQQLLPEVQQTFNWVRLAQRIPVHIELDSIPDDILLAAGMTATVRLHDD